jgi:hypothetical protein
VFLGASNYGSPEQGAVAGPNYSQPSNLTEGNTDTGTGDGGSLRPRASTEDPNVSLWSLSVTRYPTIDEESDPES